jgi:hypothetical protein
MQSIGGNHWLGGKKSSTIGWCHVLLELIVREIFNITMSYAQTHPIKQKDAFHDNNTSTTMRCLFITSKRCGWA